jgi:hypothetical protein
MKLRWEFKGTDRLGDDWRHWCGTYGLPLDGLGRTFQHKGKTYTIAGLDLGRRAYPVVCLDEAGTKILFKVVGIKQVLGLPKTEDD